MKRYTEFRGCLTSIEYDAAAGGFVQVAAPHPFTAAPEPVPEVQDPAAAGDAVAVEVPPAAGEMQPEVKGHATTNGASTGDSIRRLQADGETARRRPGAAATVGAGKTIPELQRPATYETI
jgi:hypothetical protein